MEISEILHLPEVAHAILELPTSAVIILDSQGNIIYANNMLSSWMEYSWEEVQGMHISKLPVLTTKSKIIAVEKFAERMLGKKVEPYDLEFVTKTGKIETGRLTAKLIKDNQNKILVDIVVVENITDVRESEKTIHKKEKELSEYLNIIDEIILILNVNVTIEYINETGANILGYKAQELLGKNWIEWCIPEKNRPFIQSIKQDIQKTHAIKYTIVENTVLCKDGTEKLISWRNSIRTNDVGMIDGTISSGRDITEKKQFEEELLKTKVFLESIVENIPNMVFVKDAKDLRFQLLNKVGEKYFGHKQKELLGKNDYDFFPKSQADFFVQKDRDVLKSKTLLDIPEEPINTPNGQRILHTKKIPIVGNDGEPTSLLGISEDITNTISQDKELKEEKLMSDEIINSLPGIFYLFDSEGKFLRWNKHHEDVLELTKEEMENRKPTDNYDDADRPKITEVIKYVLEHGTGSIEATLYTKSGKPIPYFLTGVRIQYKGKTCVMGVGLDISERKKTEQAITQHTKELEDINKLMIGRELKMVELKKEIEQLKSQLRLFNSSDQSDSDKQDIS
jgi:PAS domain S-box-containing protein